ncbi:MAG: hypothetical protein JRH10_18125 [Deltaproteobacteria bacterium]|nr:hypothetical protein [Deltaproteobacteria bacterium]
MTLRPIRFGTSGWRGVIGEEFTLPRARAVVRGVARWLKETRQPLRVLVAHDSRPGGARLSSESSALLASEGVRVERVPGVTPTPVLARAVTGRRHGAGLIFTASHNPASYQGLKVLAATGGVLERAPTRRLEQLANGALREGELERAGERARGRPGARVEPVDLLPEYRAALHQRLDCGGSARRPVRVYYDAMHGAGAGVLDRVLEDSGARVRGSRLGRDARFAGVGPDPVAAKLGDLGRAVAGGRGLRLGIATDGDADRYAAVDETGRVLSATEAVALLVDHLARTGRIHRGVAISVATGSLVERVAQSHGLAVTRHPIGFKWLTAALHAGEADCAGEESGGFVWAPHGFDKDGILAGALLAEVVATTGAPLGARLAELEREHGPCHCGRTEGSADAGCIERLAVLLRDPPRRVGSARVVAVDRHDGLRLALADGFLMLRASGTEPVVRVYAEAPSAAALRARLGLGARWLAGRSSGNLAN